MEEFQVVILGSSDLPAILGRLSRHDDYRFRTSEPSGWITFLGQRQWNWTPLSEPNQYLAAPVDPIMMKVQLLNGTRVTTLPPVEVNAESIDGVVQYTIHVRLFRPGDAAASTRRTVIPPENGEDGIDFWNPGLSISIWPTVQEGLIVDPDGIAHSATVDQGGCEVALMTQTADNDWARWADYGATSHMERAAREIAQSLTSG